MFDSFVPSSGNTWDKSFNSSFTSECGNAESADAITPGVAIKNLPASGASGEVIDIPPPAPASDFSLILVDTPLSQEAEFTTNRNETQVVDALTRQALPAAVVEGAISSAHSALAELAAGPDFADKMNLAFGEGWDAAVAGDLAQDWLTGDFSELPPVEIRAGAEINGANGAFAAATDTIYLSSEFVTGNAGRPEAIVSVLLEEMGHYIDSRINTSDAAGDEGAIFAGAVQGKEFDTAELQALKAEDDTATVMLDGKAILIEQAVPSTDNAWDIASGDNTRFDGAIWSGEVDERWRTSPELLQLYTDLSTAVLGQRFQMTAGYAYDQSYFNGQGKWHAGIDIGAPAGTSVKAALGGTVAWTWSSSTAGAFIGVNSSDGRQWVYGHLQSFGNFQQGSSITAGQTIGQVGNQSEANHLHLEVRTPSFQGTNGASSNQNFILSATMSPLQAFWLSRGNTIPSQPSQPVYSIGSLSLNQTQSGSLSTTDRANPTRTGSFSDDYRLSGFSAGQQVQLNMSSTAFDSYLQLVNESTGQVIQFDDDSGGNNNSRLSFTAQSGVSYLVRATSFGSGSTGSYSLSAAPVAPPPTVTISATDASAGETLSGQTANPGQFTISRTGSTAAALTVNYSVAGTATNGTDYSNPTGSVTIAAGATSAAIPVNVIDDSLVEGNETATVTLAANTAYTVGSANTATVTIADNDPTTVPIALNQSLSGTLSTTDRANPTRTGSFSDDYRLTGFSAGQQVQLNMSSTAFDSYLQLVNQSTGQVIQFDDDSGGNNNSRLNFTAQSGVSYLVRATSFGSGSTGSYSLSATSAAPSSTVTISATPILSLNQTQSGSLSTTDRANPTRTGSFSDDYSLRGFSAGQQVQLNMSSTAFDSYLQLVNESTGQVIQFDDDSGGNNNSRLSFTAQSGVNYLVRATSYGSGSTGSYNLSASWMNFGVYL